MAPVDSSVNHAASNGTGNNRDHNDHDAEVHVHSIHRVVDIPVVKSALGYASGFYTRVKGYNPTLESGFSRAEQTVLLVADTAKPVIQKLEKPSKYIVSPIPSSSLLLVYWEIADREIFRRCLPPLLQSITRTI